jgi:hypothetical protein
MVKLIKNRRLEVHFLDSNENEFAGKTYTVSDWPENIKNPKLLPGNEWNIKLNNDEKSIYSISPQNGQFLVKVKKFVSKEGVPPTPKFMRDWKYPDHVFFVLLEIVGGLESCIGMEILLMVPYRFDEDEDGNTKYTKWNDRSNTVKTDQFLTYSGGWDVGALKFDDNLLPAFQKRILKADKTFGVIVKNGFVDYMISGQSSENPETDKENWADDDWDNLDPTETSPKPVETESTEFDW